MFSKGSRSEVCLVLLVTMAVTCLAGVTDDLSSGWFGPEFGVLQKVYDDCQHKNDFTGCLKGKALVALTKAADQDTISIVDGVYLERQNSSSIEATPSITSARAMDDLHGIDKQLMQKLDRFLRSHVVKMDMSEGREKGKKERKRLHHYIIAALLTAMGIAGPMALKAIGMIAGMALVTSKVALTIAGIIALKKIYSSDHHHHEETSFQVHATGDVDRRSTYVVRPVKTSSATASMAYPTDQTIDPYRYYYDNPATGTVQQF